MMVGDNLGETQLQQLVDRQLAASPEGVPQKARKSIRIKTWYIVYGIEYIYGVW